MKSVGRIENFLLLKLVVHEVTNRLLKVKKFDSSTQCCGRFIPLLILIFLM